MDTETAKDKIKKLMAHQQSAKRIGNHDEARMYAQTITRLCRKYKLTRRCAMEPPQIAALKGEYECSCGFSISLTINAGSATNILAEMMLGPHKQPGHVLKQVAC